MKLWLLRPRKRRTGKDPWSPWYDKAFGFVVRAHTAQQARALAVARAGAEGDEAWTAQYSTCVRLTEDGEEGVVMEDFHSA